MKLGAGVSVAVLDTRRPNPAHFGVQGGILAVSDNEENIRSRETFVIYRRQGFQG
jgi:hypothetical protein